MSSAMTILTEEEIAYQVCSLVLCCRKKCQSRKGMKHRREDLNVYYCITVVTV